MDIDPIFYYEEATMNVSLTTKLEEFVRRKVTSGLYNNASEVVREGLRRLVEQETTAVAARVGSG